MNRSMPLKSTILHAFLIALVSLGQSSSAQQAVDVTDETAVASKSAHKPAIGQEATAKKYFKGRKVSSVSSGSSGDRFLALQIGSFLNENLYKWGHGNANDVGRLNGGVTYKIGGWSNSMDLALRADLTTYTLIEGRAVKLTLMPVIMFPDAATQFPLYFGAGGGLGVFFKQIADESSVAFDYSIFGGARVFDLIKGVGLVVEAGLKNHVLLLSDGQYNGVFFNIGTVFRF